jgi:flap endonuclease GEN
MCDIEEKLDLDREKMVALALLVGCDYVPKGVPGAALC